MHKHHEEAIENLIAFYKGKPGIIAVILGGSVAKGLERIDSDIDAVIVVTDEKYGELAWEGRLCEGPADGCNYDGGYYDVKFVTKGFLAAVGSHGSEPARNAFVKARVLFSYDAEIYDIVPRLGVYPKHEKDERMKSFFSAFAMHQGYYWDCAKNNPYLKIRTVSEIILYGYRLLLLHNETLFPCQRNLVETVAELADKPVGIVEKGNRFISVMTQEAKDDFAQSITDFFKFPETMWHGSVARFVDDNEQWWYKNRPNIAEW